MTEAPLALKDLLSANVGDVRDPYTGYARARAEHPVRLVDHLGAKVFMVYTFDEASTVLGDGETYSAAINGRWMRPLLGRTILEMDGRTHFIHRKLIGHAFRPTVAAGWEGGLIRPLAEQLVDGIAPAGAAEMVTAFTWRMPVRVFAEIVGVPSIDHARWQRWAVELETAALDWERGRAASKEVEEYFAPVIEARRGAPGNDLISDLAQAEIEGERLADDLIHGFLRLLVPAGAGTTYRLMGSMLYALLTHPEQLDEVRKDRSLIGKAVEETLRWESPVQFAVRNTTVDTMLGGVEIPKDSVVTVALGSANRDERRFPEPDRFDVHRDGAPHIAFGDGAHRCLGEHLARVEAKVALDVILDRLPALRLDPGEQAPHEQGYAFRSPSSLPVVFDVA